MSKEITLNELFNNYIFLENESIKADERLGKGVAKQVAFNKDFGLYNMNFNLNEDMFFYTQVHRSFSSFCTLAKGEIRYEDFDSGTKFKYSTNKTMLISSNKEYGVSFVEKNREVDLYFLYANKDFILPILKNSKSKELQTLAKKWENEDIYDIKALNINAEDLRKLYRFKDFGFADELEKLYLTSTAYELLHGWLKSYDDEKLPQEEAKYILMVEEYILDNIESEFSLKHLARIAKTNEKKLQRNFKIHFGENLFDYILEKRMKHAKILLKSKEYNINEVAKKVGYKHQSNFTRMFYKHFKVLPKDMKNS